MPRTDFRLAHPLRVRWAEVDPQNIVFNANYLLYFDVAAGEYWRALGFGYPDGFSAFGVDTFVVKATLEFQAPARYDDELELLARTLRIGRTSLRMALEVHRGEQLLVAGEMIYVFAHPTARTPTPVPDALRSAIAQYEHVPPET